MVPLSKLTQAATDRLAKQLDFVVLDQGAERHGAWEWSWARRDAARAYHVTLGALEVAPKTYRLEVWACVDDGTRYGKALVGEIDATEDDILEKDPEPVLQILVSAAKQAWDVRATASSRPTRPGKGSLS